jgi:hypothetical protein
VSSAPLKAPSLSPPRRSCRICVAVAWHSAAETGATAGAREERSKFAEDSGSRASILMVRQLVERDMVKEMNCFLTMMVVQKGQGASMSMEGGK